MLSNKKYDEDYKNFKLSFLNFRLISCKFVNHFLDNKCKKNHAIKNGNNLLVNKLVLPKINRQKSIKNMLIQITNKFTNVY